MSEKPCFHCYQLGHPPTEICPNEGIIACTKCFRLYVFSTGCNCLNKRRPDPPQVLRLIGKKKAPKWVTDVCINDRYFPALLNTSISRCRVTSMFATWFKSENSTQSETGDKILSIDIQRKGRRIRVSCDIVEELLDDVHIHLGTELMTFLGYVFTMENISIKSNHSPILSTPFESEYVYNLPSVGEDLRKYLIRKRQFLKKGKPVTKSYGDLKPRQPSRVVVIRNSSTSSEYSNRVSDGRRSSTSSSESRHWVHPVITDIIGKYYHFHS